MKEFYVAPDMEVLKCIFIADALEPSQEATVPTQYNTFDPNDPTMPTEMDF